MRLFVALSLLGYLFSAAMVHAAPPGSVPVSESDLFIRGGYKCSLLGTKYLAGRTIGSTYFLAFKTERANLKKKAVKSSGAQRAKLQKQVDALLVKSKKGDAACKSGPPISAPTPTTTPIPTQNNFDSSGNVTDIGKQNFEIPPELSANITQGAALHGSYCVGCHSGKLGRKFNFLRSAIANSPMLFSEQEISDQALANLTAYLNRFNM